MEKTIIPNLDRIYIYLYNILKEYPSFNEKEYYKAINTLDLEHNCVELHYGMVSFYIKFKNSNLVELKIYENEESSAKNWDLFSKKIDLKETIRIKEYIVSTGGVELVDMYYKQSLVNKESNYLRMMQIYKMKKYPNYIKRALSFPERKFIIDIVTYHDEDMGGFAQIINGSKFGNLYTSKRIDNITEGITIFETEILELGGLLNIDKLPEKIEAKIAYQYKVEFLGNYIEFKIDGSSNNAVLNYQTNLNIKRIPQSIEKKIRDKIEIAKRSGFEIKKNAILLNT